MKIVLTSVLVEYQQHALQFYTEKLGFVKKQDIPMGEYSFITVASPDQPDGPELLLEPNENPSAKTFQSALFEQGIPVASFGVDDVQKVHERLQTLGVHFTMAPTQMGPVTLAVLDDTCGNLIQIAQQ